MGYERVHNAEGVHTHAQVLSLLLYQMPQRLIKGRWTNYKLRITCRPKCDWKHFVSILLISLS